LEAASRLVAAAVWKDYFQAHEALGWYWQAVKGCDDREEERLLGALRIGAVALLAGTVSLAIEVVLDVRDVVNPAELESWVRRRPVAAREQVISEMYGRYLGTDAEAALADFAGFAAVVASGVQGPSSTESPGS
ncbi:MAG: hypothetical protein ACRDX9_03190, partial [Acidimicrobiia bacterium]